MKNLVALLFLALLLALTTVAAAAPLSQETLNSLPPEIRAKIAQEIPKTTATAEVTPSATTAIPVVISPKIPTDLSKLEKQYQDGYGSDLSGKLRQFGYNLFADSTIKPSKLATPGPDYLLGPGDILRIRVWGSEIDADMVGTIDRYGNINIPKIGLVPLTGTKFGEVEEVIRNEAEKYIQGINISVTFEALRSVEIYVVGSVQQPGLHLVPAFSTTLDGLLTAGGPLKSGSLRGVTLYRDGAPTQTIDLYNLLLRGKRDFDVELHDRDVIFVPRLQQTAAVAGAVLEEGIFELHGETTVGNLLQLAGGILPQGFTGRMLLRRYQDNRQFVVQDIDTRQKEAIWQETPIHDGDLLELQYLPPENAKTVRLEGHVWIPNEVKYVPGLKLSQLLPGPEILKHDAVTDFALLYRYDPATTRSVAKRFPLSKVFSHDFDMALHPFDNIRILSRKELGIVDYISVTGAVWAPGDMQFEPGLTLSGALGLAGGEQFGANLHRIELSRQEIMHDTLTMQHVTLDFAQNGDFALQPYDNLFIPRHKDATANKKITLSGEIKYPGTYRIKEGERISDVIQRAGGFSPDAYFYGAKYTSPKARAIQQQSIDSLTRDLELRSQQVFGEMSQTAVSATDVEAAKAGETTLRNFIAKLKAVVPEGRVSIKLAPLDSFRGSQYDFTVEDGDTLDIPKRPNFVATMGSVFSPNAYLYQPEMTVADYLHKSGGPTKSADDDYIYVLKANGEVLAKASSEGLFSRFASHTLMPGDTIVVPEDLERLPYLRLTRDIADIMFKIATTAGIAFAAM